MQTQKIIYKNGETLSCIRCGVSLYRVTQDIEEDSAHSEIHLESLPGIPKLRNGDKIHCPLCKYWDIAGPFWMFVGSESGPPMRQQTEVREPVITEAWRSRPLMPPKPPKRGRPGMYSSTKINPPEPEKKTGFWDRFRGA